MWITRKKFEYLAEKLATLEREVSYIKWQNTQTVYSKKTMAEQQNAATQHPVYQLGAYGLQPYVSIPSTNLTAWDAINRIMKFLDVELDYVEGQAADAVVVKKGK